MPNYRDQASGQSAEEQRIDSIADPRARFIAASKFYSTHGRWPGQGSRAGQANGSRADQTGADPRENFLRKCRDVFGGAGGSYHQDQASQGTSQASQASQASGQPGQQTAGRVYRTDSGPSGYMVLNGNIEPSRRMDSGTRVAHFG